MDFKDKVTADDIISEVTLMLNDTAMDKGISYGAYMNSVQRAVEDLHINLFMSTRTMDIEVPKDTLKIEMPDDAFNVREFYLHNGVCCQPGGDMAIVHWKRMYNNSQGGAGYTAPRKETQETDIFFNPLFSGGGPDYRSYPMYYANIENGLIMFGENCRVYKYFRIVFNTLGGKIGEAMEIPRIVRRCITLMVAKDNCMKLMTRDRMTYQVMYQAISGELDTPRTGALDKAESMLARMGTWKRNEFLLRNGTAKY
jgi:hypothetical protein